MMPYQLRVVIEKAELGLKMDALSQFIHGTEAYKSLPVDEQELLCLQYDAMNRYHSLLGQRIDKF